MNNNNNPINIDTRIGLNSFLKGKMNFKTSLKMEGNLIGRVEGNYLYITSTAKIEGDVIVSNLDVDGKILGQINVSEKVTLMQKSDITGNINTNLIKIEEGAIFEGRCETVNNVDNIDIFSQSIQELRELLI